MKEKIETQDAPTAIGPYSQAILAGGFIFTSGQIALISGTLDLDMADIRTETKRVMINLNAVLQAAGSNMDHVVKTTIYLTDMAFYSDVNDVYASFFNGVAPAREAVQVAGLPKGVHVEISMIAIKA